MSYQARLQKIVKQKISALSIFEEARKKLEDVMNSLQREEQASNTRIKELSDGIDRENEHISSVHSEMDNTLKSIQKIESILM